MVRLLKAASILGIIAMLAIGASPAPAAKGVKKTQENHIQGTVVSVQVMQGNAKGKKGPHAILTIQVTNQKHKKNQNTNANAVVAKGTTQTFNITTRSRIEVNQNVKGVGIAALRQGEHVTVFAHNHHADKVVIHHHANVKKNG